MARALKLVFLLVFTPTSLLHAQISSSSQWIWMKGDNIPGQYGNYGTKGVEASSNNPGVRCKAAYWKDTTGNFWLFGGEGFITGSGYELNDLWKYNPSTNNWTWMNGSNAMYPVGTYGIKGVPAASNTPGGRNNNTFWTDKDGNFWLYGGYGYFNTTTDGVFSDLWKYEPATNQWTWMNGSNLPNQPANYGTQGIPSSTNQPGTRLASACWTDNDGNFWLFGGEAYVSGNFVKKNDLWKYDPVTNEWTWINGGTGFNQSGVYGTRGVPDSSNQPGARQLCAGWKDTNGNIWLFGGDGFDANGLGSYLSDLWKYDFSINQWTWVNGDSLANQYGIYGTQGISSQINKPGGRIGPTFWKDCSENLWIYGGPGYGQNTSGYLSDLWKYDPSADEWTWVKGSPGGDGPSYGTMGVPSPTNTPGGRFGAAGWKDIQNNFWLYGGATPTNFRSDLWKLSGNFIKYFADIDGDGYGNVVNFVFACKAPAGYTNDSTDCNDADNTINPGATEICENGIDDDCDGLIDEDCSTGIIYRSRQTGNWNNIATWEVSANGGLTWANATATPTFDDATVAIRNGHTVTITAAVTIDEVTVDAGGILTQQQNVTVNNGPGEDISVNGIYNLDNNAIVTGNGSLLINLVFNFNSGDIQTRVAVAPAATMNITTVAAKTLRSEILNNGTINWVKGNISFQAGTLTNNGNFNISNANSLLNTSGTNGFINKPTGITTKVSGGANALEIPAANEGIIRGTGTLSFGTCNNIGIIAPGTSPGTITYNSDNDLFTPFSELRIEINDLSGPGVGHDQLRRAGNIVLNGKLTVTETGSAPAGSYEIMRSTSGTITGNFATLQLPPGYSLRIQNNSRLWLDKVSTLRTASGSDMTVKQAIVNDKIIFPNPADRYVSIRMMDQLAKGSITIQMADNTGKVIKQWSALYMGKNSIITLNTGNFANGLYMLLITDSTGKMLCGKVMVRH